MRNEKSWQAYEELALEIVRMLSDDLGLTHVEEKQTIEGRLTGTHWEIDGKAVCGGEIFFIIEARRRKARAKQSEIAQLAFQIEDAGAIGGVYVSPVPFQEGARKVAAATNILHVQLEPGGTPVEFIGRFLETILVKQTETISVTHRLTSIRVERVTDEKDKPSPEDPSTPPN